MKLHRGSERAEPSETAERCPDPSDRTAGTVEIEAGGERREVGVIEAIEEIDGAVIELYELGEARGETVSELAQDDDERAEAVDDLRDGLEELAGYFAELIEEAGGEVEYQHIEDTEPPIMEALEDVDMEGFAA